jgi:hypothetical protein
MAFAKYNKFLYNQMNGGAGTSAKVIDFDTDTIKVMLVTATYTPTYTTHATKADVTNEVSGTNYTAGGATLTSPTLTESSGTVTFDAADTTWTQNAGGFTNARYAILYKSTGTDSTSALVGCLDLVADKGNVAGDLTIQWNASGVATWA